METLITELLVFYGGLTLAVGLGVGYSLYRYRKHMKRRQASTQWRRILHRRTIAAVPALYFD